MIIPKDKLTKNEKISLAMRGMTLSKDHRQKLSIAKIGTSQSDVTRAKIKKTILGNNFIHFNKNHPEVPKTNKSHSHLTATDVKEVRDRYSNESDASIRKLAEDFGVSRHTIHSIINYKIWK